MNKILGIALIVGALVLGYLGFNKVDNSGGSVEVVGVELSAQDNGAKTTGFVLIGLAVASLIGGATVLNKKA